MNDINNRKKADILVVDDHLENVNLLFELLTTEGYDVRQVISGHQALQAVSFEAPDLILLDIMMPDLDGYQVCKSLKSIPETKDIPVIFLTALGDPKDKVKGFDVGGADYVTKPFQAQEVLARVKHQITILNQKRQLTQQNAQLLKEISAKEKAQQELQELNQKLERSNKELERFNSLVAHDLKQPLTVIKGYTQLLFSKQKNLLNQQEISFINQILNAVNYMSEVIEDLLAYARVGGDDNSQLQLINCNEILAQVLELLQSEIQAKNALIKYEPLPILFGDHVKLTQLLHNLIGNALKYCDKKRPEIEISVEKIDSQWQFKIQDNGLGIPLESQEEIFKILKRLDRTKNISGTGIGLALCKKIVEFHRGKIWVESDGKCGSNFYFTIPLN
jgi:signal transduction histidine kinase